MARPIGSLRIGRLWWTSFADVAGVASRPFGAEPVVHVDVGTGLRIHVPGFGGVLGFDAAYGVRDAAVRVSATVRRAWPGR